MNEHTLNERFAKCCCLYMCCVAVCVTFVFCVCLCTGVCVCLLPSPAWFLSAGRWGSDLWGGPLACSGTTGSHAPRPHSPRPSHMTCPPPPLSPRADAADPEGTEFEQTNTHTNKHSLNHAQFTTSERRMATWCSVLTLPYRPGCGSNGTPSQ